MPSSVMIIPLTPAPLVGPLLRFDITYEQSTELMGTAIRHPKESVLAPLTDDVLLEPAVVMISGAFTDHPLSYVPGLPGRAATLYEALRELRRSKIMCILVTSDDIIAPCVVETLTQRRTVDTGDGVEFTVRFAEIDIGELQLAPAVVDAEVKALGQQAVEIGSKA